MTVSDRTLSAMSMGDLLSLNKRIIAEHKRRQADAVGDFYPGQAVTYKSRGRGTNVVGVVEKLNRKTVSVRVAGQLWRVSPSLLREFK